MEQMIGMLSQMLGGDAVRQMSRSLGADEQATGGAMEAALGALMGALARNASNPQGAEALARAVQKDHDGSVLDGLTDRLRAPEQLQSAGEGILRHVFGDRRSAVESGLGQASGVDPQAMGKMLTTLAPVVLGYLGRMSRERQLDAGALAGMLHQETEAVARKQPQAASFLSKILDADDDGSVVDDLSRIGGSLLGGLFGKNRG